MNKNMKHGFTLIELLIVVAIIAILAAIAIPNFLAAQIRSKVSRVKTDMRTLDVGIESYYVDNNDFPLEYLFVGNPGNEKARMFKIYQQLTTPIAYNTSIPTDPFAKPGANAGTSYQNNVYYWYYNWEGRVMTMNGQPKPYGQLINLKYFNYDPWWWGETAGVMLSTGPSYTTVAGQNGGMGTYDPTNGVNSLGYLNRLFPNGQIGS